MISEIPRRAFFQFELQLRRMERAPLIDGDMAKWKPAHLLPNLGELEGRPAVADVYAGWHEDYLAVAFDVSSGRPPRCDTEQWWKGDGLRLCIDTRDARDVKRATRYCHFFYLLPDRGAPRTAPVIGLHKMSRAKEPPPKVDLSLVKVAARSSRAGYALEALFPAACLQGWNPAEHPRIGLYYKVKDTGAGSQHLTVGDDMGWNSDPSTWATAVLAR